MDNISVLFTGVAVKIIDTPFTWSYDFEQRQLARHLYVSQVEITDIFNLMISYDNDIKAETKEELWLVNGIDLKVQVSVQPFRLCSYNDTVYLNYGTRSLQLSHDKVIVTDRADENTIRKFKRCG